MKVPFYYKFMFLFYWILGSIILIVALIYPNTADRFLLSVCASCLCFMLSMQMQGLVK